MVSRSRSLFDREILGPAIIESFKKLDPRIQVRNTVMFVCEVGALVTLVYAVHDALKGNGQFGFDIAISLWLWFTVVFANLAEAVAEGRGKAQADYLRRTKTETMANRVVDGNVTVVSATQLRKGDRVRVSAGELIPADGDIVEGAATVDESAITGESAPVIREAGGDRSGVTGGTRVLSDTIVFVVGANPGESFLDRMISLVEGAQRQKTPNEIALSILLAGLTIVFLVAVATLAPFSIYAGSKPNIVVLIALLVCLIPTTIGGLLSAIGIAGMDRVLQRNVLAMSGRAVEAAGDVDTLLLDKTGTITLGNRQASEIIVDANVDEARAYKAAYFSSLADETPEGRSIVIFAAPKAGLSADVQLYGDARPELPAGRVVRALQCLHAHERARLRRRPQNPQGRTGRRTGLGDGARRECELAAARRSNRTDRPWRRHAAAARRRARSARRSSRSKTFSNPT